MNHHHITNKAVSYIYSKRQGSCMFGFSCLHCILENMTKGHDRIQVSSRNNISCLKRKHVVSLYLARLHRKTPWYALAPNKFASLSTPVQLDDSIVYRLVHWLLNIRRNSTLENYGVYISVFGRTCDDKAPKVKWALGTSVLLKPLHTLDLLSNLLDEIFFFCRIFRVPYVLEIFFQLSGPFRGTTKNSINNVCNYMPENLQILNVLYVLYTVRMLNNCIDKLSLRWFFKGFVHFNYLHCIFCLVLNSYVCLLCGQEYIFHTHNWVHDDCVRLFQIYLTKHAEELYFHRKQRRCCRLHDLLVLV